VSASSGTIVKQVHDGAAQPIAVFDELPVTVKTERLVQEPETSLDQDLIFVETERETQLAFIQQLDNLHDMLGRITNRDHCRRALIAKIGHDYRTIDE
jgi:hypothetical protein